MHFIQSPDLTAKGWLLQIPDIIPRYYTHRGVTRLIWNLMVPSSAPAKLTYDAHSLKSIKTFDFMNYCIYNYILLRPWRELHRLRSDPLVQGSRVTGRRYKIRVCTNIVCIEAYFRFSLILNIHWLTLDYYFFPLYFIE